MRGARDNVFMSAATREHPRDRAEGSYMTLLDAIETLVRANADLKTLNAEASDDRLEALAADVDYAVSNLCASVGLRRESMERARRKKGSAAADMYPRDWTPPRPADEAALEDWLTHADAASRLRAGA